MEYILYVLIATTYIDNVPVKNTELLQTRFQSICNFNQQVAQKQAPKNVVVKCYPVKRIDV